jgi:hypothetical protein
MKTFTDLIKMGWGLRAIALIAGVLACLGWSVQGAEQESVRSLTLRMLEKRREQQIRDIKPLKAFHDFQFTDRIRESQIEFEHHIVEDAGKQYKAAHYDHGNGIAAADVDGGGLIDIYFTTQLGMNQL